MAEKYKNPKSRGDDEIKIRISKQKKLLLKQKAAEQGKSLSNFIKTILDSILGN